MTTIHKLTLGLGIIALLAFIPASGVDASCQEDYRDCFYDPDKANLPPPPERATPTPEDSSPCKTTSSYPGYEWLDEGACGCHAYGLKDSGWDTDDWQPEYGKACEQLCSDLWDCRHGERGETPATGGSLLDIIPPDPPDEPSLDDPANQFCQPPDDSLGQAPNNGIIPIANAQIYSNYSVVTHTEGEVLIKTKNAPRWAPAFKGQRMTIGDKIKTGRNGKAELKFANSAVFTMRPTSQLEIPDHKNPSYCQLSFTGKVMFKLGGKLKEYAIRSWKIDQQYAYSLRTATAIAGGGRPNPLKGQTNPNTEIATSEQEIMEAMFGISDANALGDDTILFGEYDESTGTASFYVEAGNIDILDPSETTSVPLVAGEYLAVESGTLPQADNILPGLAIEDPWWESSINNKLGYINLLYFIAGLGITITIARKMKKRGKIIKTIVVIVGISITIVIISFLNADLLTYLLSD